MEGGKITRIASCWDHLPITPEQRPHRVRNTERLLGKNLLGEGLTNEDGGQLRKRARWGHHKHLHHHPSIICVIKSVLDGGRPLPFVIATPSAKPLVL